MLCVAMRVIEASCLPLFMQRFIRMPRKCRRSHSALQRCYYCHLRHLQTDNVKHVVTPEERLLAEIFGEGRFFRIHS